MSTPFDILVVSDATGTTAEAVATSVLVQFEDVQSRVQRFPFVRSPAQIDEVLERAPRSTCVVVFTFVSRELSETLERRCAERGLPVIDLLTPMMAAFAEVLEEAPSGTPGLQRRHGEDLYKVTEAIRFTLDHDDGRNLETVHGADLVILGVSRSGKTPVSIYLSCRKLKVANIPIIKDTPLPAAIRRLAAAKVGLRMDLDRQLQMRTERSRHMGTDMPWYADRASIFAELGYCEEVFRSIPGLHTVNVTNRSIEETSDWIVRNVL
jgi:regulator of PEP synthase PpsR (kinase-PPPase family)